MAAAWRSLPTTPVGLRALYHHHRGLGFRSPAARIRQAPRCHSGRPTERRLGSSRKGICARLTSPRVARERSRGPVAHEADLEQRRRHRVCAQPTRRTVTRFCLWERRRRQARFRHLGAPSGGWFPSFLPDGRHFLEFVPTTSQPENAGVWVVSLETGARSKLVDSQSNAIYAPRVISCSGGKEPVGAAVRCQTRKSRQPARSGKGGRSEPGDQPGALFSLDSGTLAFFAGAVGETELVWLDRNGNGIGSWRQRGYQYHLVVARCCERRLRQADPTPRRSISGNSCSTVATPRS